MSKRFDWLLIVFYWLKIVYGNDRPVVGILAQEIRPDNSYAREYKSFISASYVKAVEASGARVVPIFIDREPEYYENLAGQLNGYVFPGGGADVTLNSGYARASRKIYQLVSKLNQDGKNVPILGVCLGMEMLTNIVAGKDARTNCCVIGEALNLNFRPGYRKSSLYEKASRYDLDTLSRFNSTLNYHRYCVTEETLKILGYGYWHILSTSKGASGDVFISSMEMRNLPIAAIIFHPEKNAYEWNSKQANPHDVRSIEAARIFYDWLVAESRKNNLKYKKAEDIMDDLIQNYNPIFTGKKLLYNYQTYFFPSR